MASEGAELEIFLNETLAGRLTLLSHGLTGPDQSEFALDEGYLRMMPRPVLGQSFEDDLSARHRSRMKLPPFFSNLLPEGPLRELIAQRENVSPEREFFLLARLGQDLPGAIIARPAGKIVPPDDGPASPASAPSQRPLRFSLAGVQLKFSMLREGRGLTLPVTGSGGDWIAKLPHAQLAHVPENELSMMKWAKHAGLDVPEVALFSPGDVAGLPPEAATVVGAIYGIRRFDREPGGVRVHIEDMAQVLGVHPSRKYKAANYETIARIVHALGGAPDLRELVGRLVFIAAIGNADAHEKNWSLIYRDPAVARLSPAYDLVSTIQYPNVDARLGLNLAGSKQFERVSMDSFRHLERVLAVPDGSLTSTASEMAERTRESWKALRSELPIPEEFKARIEKHWETVPLMTGR